MELSFFYFGHLIIQLTAFFTVSDKNRQIRRFRSIWNAVQRLNKDIGVAFSHVKQMPHRKEDTAISYGAHSAT